MKSQEIDDNLLSHSTQHALNAHTHILSQWLSGKSKGLEHRSAS